MVIALIALFFVILGTYVFINAKKIVPPERDAEWWITARIMSPVMVALGLGMLWFAFVPD